MKTTKTKAVCFDMWGTLCESGGKNQWQELQNILGADSMDKTAFIREGEKNLLLYSNSLREGIKNLALQLKL